MAIANGDDPYLVLPMLSKVPEKYDFLNYAWEAFWTLSNGRGIISGVEGNSPAPLTFDSVYYYAKIYGYDRPDDFEELELYIRTLDNAYLEYQNSKRAK